MFGRVFIILNKFEALIYVYEENLLVISLNDMESSRHSGIKFKDWSESGVIDASF